MRVMQLSASIVLLCACDAFAEKSPTTVAGPQPQGDAPPNAAAAIDGDRSDQPPFIPPPDFEGNWYVLNAGETLEAFEARTGADKAIIEKHAREIDRRWFVDRIAHIEKAFPDIKEAFGGRIRAPHLGSSHIVEDGEDIWGIARRFHTSALEIMVANLLHADAATKLEPGLRLFIPGVVRDDKGHIHRFPKPWDEKAKSRASELDLGGRGAAARLLRGEMDARWLTYVGEAHDEGHFEVPVVGGWFVRGFGAGEAGYHKAVDFGGKIDWPVRAIDDGVVAYSGDELRGYGNIVMVLHAGGFVSFYAHLTHSFVHAGEEVKRGEVIAELGSTGVSKGPHVHFELIHRHNNCDPLPLLRPEIRNPKGETMPVQVVVWDGVSKNPKPVRCEHRPAHHPSSRYVHHENPHDDKPPAPPRAKLH